MLSHNIFTLSAKQLFKQATTKAARIGAAIFPLGIAALAEGIAWWANPCGPSAASCFLTSLIALACTGNFFGTTLSNQLLLNEQVLDDE